jgi:hypothetical protein
VVVKLNYAEYLAVPVEEHREFVAFLQKMMNRRQVGHLRYGVIKKRQRYIHRLQKELAKYIETGNMENLLNIANYAFLESYCKEHPTFHSDSAAESASRGV